MGPASNISPSPPPPPTATVLHQSEVDEEDENVKQLNECSTIYLALQECLAQTNRNWKSCQPEVQALKACHKMRSERSGKEK